MRRLLLALAIAILPTLPASAEEVRVFAAASLQGMLDEIAAEFRAETGHDVVISYAGSNALARQIIAGAPADIYISANPGWMAEVEKAGLVLGSAQDLLQNQLVLIAHDDLPPVKIDADLDLVAMLGGQKLAMALVDAVPAGQYGKAALESLGLWDAVAGSVAQTDNVRAALALVALGEAPFGITYGSDAVAEARVHVIGTFPVGSHPPIIYPAALLRGAQDDGDRAFLALLMSVKSDPVFRAHGFIPPVRDR